MIPKQPKYVQETLIMSEDGELLSRHEAPVDGDTVRFLNAIAPNRVGEWAGVLFNHQSGRVNNLGSELAAKLATAAAKHEVMVIAPRITARAAIRGATKTLADMLDPEPTSDDIMRSVRRAMRSISIEPEPLETCYFGEDFEVNHTLKVEQNRKIGGKHAQPFWHNKRW